jgi:hypothetical protein
LKAKPSKPVLAFVVAAVHAPATGTPTMTLPGAVEANMVADPVPGCVPGPGRPPRDVLLASQKVNKGCALAVGAVKNFGFRYSGGTALFFMVVKIVSPLAGRAVVPLPPQLAQGAQNTGGG